MAKTTDLTQGSIGKNLILFAIPLLLSSLVQQLYNTVDLIFAGNLINKSASAAIGASSLLITCLVGFFGGMSVGTGVVVSHIFGAKDHGKLKTAIHNAVALSVVGGLLFLVIGVIFAPIYLKLVNTPVELQENAVHYLRIYCISFIPMFLYNIGSGVLRALGDSRSPLYAQLAGGLINVIMDYFFLHMFENGVEAIAFATLFSQSMAAFVTVLSLQKLDASYALRWKEICFDRELLKETIRIGIPAGTQALVITLSNVIAQMQINSFGEDAIAAFTAYFKVELIIYLPIVAFGQAIMSFSGQCMGNKQIQRLRKGTGICLGISMIIAAMTSIAGLKFGPSLFRIFNSEPEVISLGCRIISITFPFYCIYCILQVLGDSLRGCGQVKQPMVIIMINICLIRSALLFLIVSRYRQIEGVAAAYPITWISTAVCMSLYYMKFHKKLTREGLLISEQ